jgi:hypothetical protein
MPNHIKRLNPKEPFYVPKTAYEPKKNERRKPNASRLFEKTGKQGFLNRKTMKTEKFQRCARGAIQWKRKIMRNPTPSATPRPYLEKRLQAGALRTILSEGWPFRRFNF